MKKTANFNFISILLLVLAVIIYSSIRSVQKDMSVLQGNMQETWKQDEIEDMEEYGLLLEGVSYAFQAVVIGCVNTYTDRIKY